jgi:hypothetical protein
MLPNFVLWLLLHPQVGNNNIDSRGEYQHRSSGVFFCGSSLMFLDRLANSSQKRSRECFLIA